MRLVMKEGISINCVVLQVDSKGFVEWQLSAHDTLIRPSNDLLKITEWKICLYNVARLIGKTVSKKFFLNPAIINDESVEPFLVVETPIYVESSDSFEEINRKRLEMKIECEELDVFVQEMLIDDFIELFEINPFLDW
jgi:hypothetical protein